uniref:uncharacterized protein LOC117608845 n=1 Tax=Osmia lignaria TaxID=473952 RepID=UPI00147904A1|nr:uncharacterized protein LOC117608845 [Osmia lignaria]
MIEFEAECLEEDPEAREFFETLNRSRKPLKDANLKDEEAGGPSMIVEESKEKSREFVAPPSEVAMEQGKGGTPGKKKGNKKKESTDHSVKSTANVRIGLEESRKVRKRAAEEETEINEEGSKRDKKEGEEFVVDNSPLAGAKRATTPVRQVGTPLKDKTEGETIEGIAEKDAIPLGRKTNRRIERGEGNQFYVEELRSKEYMITMVLGRECTSKFKRNNIVKIYKILGSRSRFLRGLKMVGFNKAEITFSDMAAANAILKMAEQEGAGFEAFLPERKKTRKGVITEWEDSIEDLEDFIMPGQGEFKFERMKKKVVKDGKSVWTEGVAILVTVKGDRLPTDLKIGAGHVALRIFPYVEQVKQCYKCFAYGHVQMQCRSLKKCLVCLGREHGACDKTPVCLNCGGNHTSLSKTCWIHQREKLIRKVMAYKNVAYATAKGIVASQLGENWDEEDLGRDAGSRDYPMLPTRRTEWWEAKEVPMEDELELLKEAKKKVKGDRVGIRRWESFSENMRRKQAGGRSRGRGRLRLEEYAAEDRSPRTQGVTINVANRFDSLQQEEVETGQEEAEYVFGEGLPVERAIKRMSKMEQRAQERIIGQLEKKRDEEFLSDLMKLIKEKGYEQEVERMLNDNKREDQRTEDEEYAYWNTTRHRPNWDIPIPEKTREKLRRRKEKYEAQKAAKEAQEQTLEDIAVRAHQQYGWTKERANQEDDYRRGRLEDLMRRIEGRVCGNRETFNDE